MSGVPRPIKHGTIGGYVTHKRRGEEACNSCLTAWRIYYQQRDGKVSRRVWRLRKHEAAARAASRRATLDKHAPKKNAKARANRAAANAARLGERSPEEATP